MMKKIEESGALTLVLLPPTLESSAIVALSQRKSNELTRNMVVIFRKNST
jgi:hypothetical protein